MCAAPRGLLSVTERGKNWCFRLKNWGRLGKKRVMIDISFVVTVVFYNKLDWSVCTV